MRIQQNAALAWSWRPERPHFLAVFFRLPRHALMCICLCLYFGTGHASTLHIGVDPRIELLTTVQLLSG